MCPTAISRFNTPQPPQAMYRFKHALIQDAAAVAACGELCQEYLARKGFDDVFTPVTLLHWMSAWPQDEAQAAALKAAWDLHKSGGIPPDMRVAFAIGVAVSAVTGCGVIALFLRYLRSHSLKFFVYYRILFGIIVIALAILRHQAG